MTKFHLRIKLNSSLLTSIPLISILKYCECKWSDSKPFYEHTKTANIRVGSNIISGEKKQLARTQ